MKKDYRACRDHNNRSGNNRKTIEHMDELDAILGHRPSVLPRVTTKGTFLDTPSAPSVILLEQRLYRCRYGAPPSHSDAEYCV